MTVLSDQSLDLPQGPCQSLGEIDLRTANAAEFTELVRGIAFHPGSDDWYQYAFLADGSTYVRWNDVGEFLVSSDGARIRCRRDGRASGESFQVYMLGQALSFALVERGFEPLHGTAVVVDGRAAVFLGNSGFGKSSLAASFLAAGHRLLTDDLLIVQPSGNGFLAYPGPPRIKLFPEMARRFLPAADRGVPMNTSASKLILPLTAQHYCATPVPLAEVYSLGAPSEAAPDQEIAITALSPRDAFVELVKNTFNRRLVHVARLQRQLRMTTHLANSMPIKRLCHARRLEQISEVRAAIEADMHHHVQHAGGE